MSYWLASSVISEDLRRNACKLASVLTLGNPPENSKWDSLVFLSSSALNVIYRGFYFFVKFFLYKRYFEE